MSLVGLENDTEGLCILLVNVVGFTKIEEAVSCFKFDVGSDLLIPIQFAENPSINLVCPLTVVVEIRIIKKT